MAAMFDDPSARPDVVRDHERTLERDGEVLLVPSWARAVAGQVPALLGGAVGVSILAWGRADASAVTWLFIVLLVGAGLWGLWQIGRDLSGSPASRVRVTAEGVHNPATGGHLAWTDILEVDLDETEIRGIPFSRWVVLLVPPAAARQWAGAGEAGGLGGFVADLHEDIDAHHGSSRIDLPASLPDPASLRAWLTREVSRRTPR